LKRGSTAHAGKAPVDGWNFLEKQSLWRWFSVEGDSNTACFLIALFQGDIKPPVRRAAVEHSVGERLSGLYDHG
jgi:hypothetical protein